MTAAVEPQQVTAPHTRLSSALEMPEPVLISVHEVAFSTAATAPVRRWTWSPVAAIRRMRPPAPHREHSARGDHPRRYSFLDNACMAREMDRL